MHRWTHSPSWRTVLQPDAATPQQFKLFLLCYWDLKKTLQQFVSDTAVWHLCVNLYIMFLPCMLLRHPDCTAGPLHLEQSLIPLFKDAFWQQEVISVGLKDLFKIHPPVCLPYHICSSCSYSMARGSWHVKTDVGRRADLPQCKASGLLKTLPNRAFVNCWEGGASEVIHAASGEHCWKSLSRLCLQSIFVLSSYHAITSQHAAAPWTGPGNWSGWKLTQLKGGKKILLQPAQISDLIYHTAALTIVPPPGR